jgi:hypothetical protein
MSCGKIRYRDEIAAKFALATTGRHDERRPKNETRVYKCPRCHRYHLTSMSLEDYQKKETGMSSEHQFTFTVTVKTKLTEGKASAEDYVREDIRQQIEEADPGQVFPDDNEYEITDWSVV